MKTAEEWVKEYSDFFNLSNGISDAINLVRHIQSQTIKDAGVRGVTPIHNGSIQDWGSPSPVSDGDWQEEWELIRGGLNE